MSSLAGNEVADGMCEIPLAVPGLYGWGQGFEEVLQQLATRISRLGADDAAPFLRCPPVISRSTIDRVQYREAFPHLLGDITVWDGASETDPVYRPSSVVLTPAACYHVYPLAGAAQRERDESVEVESWCFRNEAGPNTLRLSAFRMREFVRIGDADTVSQWRDAWVTRALEFARALGLESRIAAASDPFFGSRAQLLAARQQSQEAKYEVLVPAAGNEVAVASVNYHRAHFGDIFDLRAPSGESAHTACAAFGLERLTSALLSKHGVDVAGWPRRAREVLAGSAV